MVIPRTAGILVLPVLMLAVLSLNGCPSSKSSNSDATAPSRVEKGLVAMDEDGVLNANIRRTDYGIPHITADNLESMAFGVGYAFSQDNACMLLDVVMLYNSRRSRYFGPHENPGRNDNAYLISDFSYLALNIRQQAEDGFSRLSQYSQAMLSGYSKGFNQYLADTGSNNMDPHCAGQPWVQPISEIDLLTALLGIALMPGSGNFLTPIFMAAPPNASYEAVQIVQNIREQSPLRLARQVTAPALPLAPKGTTASNGWAIGRDLSANNQGMLLANPHFPLIGLLRMWQFQATIPGALNVMGASIYGMPGIVNIGFNENVAWTHTTSTAEHFIVFELTLDENDSSGLTYLVDGEPRTVSEKTLTLPVQVGPNQVETFTKTVYYSDYGPLLEIPNSLPWGSDGNGQFVAYSIKDANANNTDIVDFWLAMNLARNMEQVKQAFREFDGVIFNNTVAADKIGNTLYIDDSTVPNLTPQAEQALSTRSDLIQARRQAGFTILPGSDSSFDFNGAVPYEQAPKLERSDYVQNSNDSFWLTNPQQPLSGYSLLYGRTGYMQTLRSRMGHRLLGDSAGQDQRYDLDELEATLLSPRSYLAEEILDDLITLCQQQGTAPVTTTGPSGNTEAVNLAPACQQLAQWDGLLSKQSRGAHIFREFAQQFSRNPQMLTAFNRTDPLNTPTTLNPNDTVLQQLAFAVLAVRDAGVALDATLGEVQFIQLTDINGAPESIRYPWQGSFNIEGGFNVYHSDSASNSLIPYYRYPRLPGALISASAQGYHLNSGSSWMMLVNFTDEGPQARGLMTHSQSVDPRSPHRDDQTALYSQRPQLRPLYFSEQDVADHTESTLNVEYSLD